MRGLFRLQSRLFSSLTRRNALPLASQQRWMADFTVQVPGLGDSITEGVVSSWVKAPGDWCEVDDVICVIETDKVSVDIRAPEAGALKEQLAGEDDELEVGAALAVIDTDASKPEGAATPAPAATQPAAAKETSTPTPAASTPAPAAPKATPAPAAAAVPVMPGARTEHRQKMTRIRQTTARRLKDSQNTAAMLTTFNEIDCSTLMKLRSQHKDAFLAKHDIKLGFMSAFVKASAAALVDQPTVNAFVDGKEIVYHDYVDISVAVASPAGLVVPVLRNCENMSFADVERSIGDFGARARDGQLALEDMVGGTFTISNGGVFGSLMGTPILNPPQSAILGMHGIFERPVAIKGQVEIRPMMYVALTYDHRIIDGREAVTFLRKIKSNIEDPANLLLEL